MSSDLLPLRVDPFKLVKSSAVLEGRLQMGRFRRFCAELTGDEGQLFVQLQAGRDEQGVACLAGRLTGEVGLIGQRCLEPMRHPIDVPFRLALLQSEASIERLPDSYDPLVLPAEAGAVEWPVLLEDELLLSLPIIPRHPWAECSAPGEYFAAADRTDPAQ